MRMLVLAVVAGCAAAAAGPAAAQRDFAQADTNGDGVVTRAEAEALRGALFDRLDANHDGFVDQSELAALAAGAAATRGPWAAA